MNSLAARIRGAVEEVGDRLVVWCDSFWSLEWARLGVYEYPDIEAIQKVTAKLVRSDFPRSYETMRLEGTKNRP